LLGGRAGAIRPFSTKDVFAVRESVFSRTDEENDLGRQEVERFHRLFPDGSAGGTDAIDFRLVPDYS
jgi:hypothetical protein